jgi:short-subunit dehydrogenase
VLVANAGKGETHAGARVRHRGGDEVLSVNLLGALNSVAAVLPEMIERGAGRSSASQVSRPIAAFPGSGAYCASKAALSTFFESLRVELRPATFTSRRFTPASSTRR